MKQLIVIGAGAAGFMAAIAAAQKLQEAKKGQIGPKSWEIVLLEKMQEPGKKLLITGHGRCNLTHDMLDQDSYIAAYFAGGRFLYSALNQFSPEDCQEFFIRQGVPLKNQNGRIFPARDRAEDVVNALYTTAKKLGVVVSLGEAVVGLETAKDNEGIIVVTAKKKYKPAACILCTGGASYPGTGSTGEGYNWLKALGHTVIPPRASLAPLPIDLNQGLAETWEPAGISLPAVAGKILAGGKVVGKAQGDLLFTHKGISGPLSFRLSRFLPLEAQSYQPQHWQLVLDFYPQEKLPQLEENLAARLKKNPQKLVLSVLRELWPEKVALFFLAHSGINRQSLAGQISKAKQATLAGLIKNFVWDIEKPPLLAGATVTAGGLNLKEINPKTMASKLYPQLFVAGEVLDIDGDTGGYNLQAAFSTGWLAGREGANWLM